jgi:hypothetical protein
MRMYVEVAEADRKFLEEDAARCFPRHPTRDHAAELLQRIIAERRAAIAETEDQDAA